MKFYACPGKPQFIIVQNEDFWEVPFMPEGWEQKQKLRKTEIDGSKVYLLGKEYPHEDFAKRYLKIR